MDGGGSHDTPHLSEKQLPTDGYQEESLFVLWHVSPERFPKLQ